MFRFAKIRRYLTIPSRSRARIERDVDEELRVHIEMRAEALVRDGLSPDEARARALREFGDMDDARRYCAGVDRQTERRRGVASWISELRLDTVHAIRVLRRTPAFTAATVLTLSLAIGAGTAIYTIFDTYLLRPLPYPAADRLVAVEPAGVENSRNGPSLDRVDWTPVDSLFEVTARWDIDGFTILGAPYAENVTGAWVSAGFFPILGVRPAIGRAFNADEYQQPAPVALISHALWLRRFRGDSSVVGSTIVMHAVDRAAADTRVTIVGVLPRDFWSIHWRDSDVLRPMPPDPHWMPAVGRILPGASIAETRRRVEGLVRRQISGSISPTWHMTLIPALEQYSARARPMLGAVFGATLFMFLAACASVAGTLIGRLASRQGELAIRTALGGSRARIVRHLLTESAVLATVAGVLGLLISHMMLSVGARLAEQRLGVQAPGGAAALHLTVSLALRTMVVSALSGIALGAIPVLLSLRGGATRWLSGMSSMSRGVGARATSAHVRRILIATQVAVAMLLLFGAGLMVRTVARMNATTLGFRDEGVMTANVMLPQTSYPDSAARQAGIARLLEHIAHAGGVRGAAVVFPRPFQGAWQFPVTTEGASTDESSAPVATVFTVSDGYFATMDIRLRAGRLLRSTDDHRSQRVAVVSEALARRIAPAGDIIGRRIRVRVPFLPSFDDQDEMPWRTVVGVVSDTKKEFSTRASADVYVPYGQNPRNYLAMVVWRDGPELSTYESVRRAAAAADPNLVLSSIRSVRQIVAGQGGEQRGLSVLLGAFAAFALGLSALALYASLSYTVTKRRSELAVRLAVGASTRSLLNLIMAEGLTTTAIGVVGGIAASVALGRVLRAQVYGVATNDPVTLVAIAIVLTLAASAACAIPAFRAARIDPALALRDPSAS